MRACKVNSLLRSSSTLRTSVIAYSLHQQHTDFPQPRSRLAFSRRGPCVPSRSALGLSRQVRKQDCPSSPALSSSKGGSRQEIADIPRFAAPLGDAHRAHSLIFARPQLNMLGARPALVLYHQCSNHRAGFNRSRCLTLPPKPTLKSIRYRCPTSDAGWPQACAQQRRSRTTCSTAWRSAGPTYPMLTISRPAAEGLLPPRTGLPNGNGALLANAAFIVDGHSGLVSPRLQAKCAPTVRDRVKSRWPSTPTLNERAATGPTPDNVIKRRQAGSCCTTSRSARCNFSSP